MADRMDPRVDNPTAVTARSLSPSISSNTRNSTIPQLPSLGSQTLKLSPQRLLLRTVTPSVLKRQGERERDRWHHNSHRQLAKRRPRLIHKKIGAPTQRGRRGDAGAIFVESRGTVWRFPSRPLLTKSLITGSLIFCAQGNSERWSRDAILYQPNLKLLDQRHYRARPAGTKPAGTLSRCNAGTRSGAAVDYVCDLLVSGVHDKNLVR